MKVKLIFNLPEDLDDYKMANNASSMYSSIWEMDQWLRSEIKYNGKLTDDQHESYEKCRDKLNKILIENNIEL